MLKKRLTRLFLLTALAGVPAAVVMTSDADADDHTHQGTLECETAEVYFRTDSTELDGPASTILDHVAECAIAAKVDSLLVIGHADHRGPVTYNQKLALERANEVAEYLRDQNVPSTLLTSTADESEADGTLTSDDRRVEIRYILD